MGTWGAGSFDNDGALDWLHDVDPHRPFEAVNSALSCVVEAYRGELSSPACEHAIAAAEIVAAAGGHPGDGIPPSVASRAITLARDSGRELVVDAVSAVDRAETESELRDLWEGSGSPEEWRERMRDLRARLTLALPRSGAK